MVALCAVIALGGCDRQSPGAAQPGSKSAAGGVAGASAGETVGGPDAAQGGGDAFNGTLDIASRGSQMPDFTVEDPAGKTLRLPDLKGKPVLVNLWATWCGPCVLEMPMLDKLAAAHEGTLRVVTVSQDMQGADKVKPFFATHSFAHLEPWMDAKNDLGFHYNTGLLPTTVLYDAQGREVWRMVGAHDWSGPRTDAMLADVLAAK